MKKLVLLLLVSVVLLSGCSDSVVVYPQTYHTAVEMCTNNGGLVVYRVNGSGLYSSKLYVSCDDGANYKLRMVIGNITTTTKSGLPMTRRDTISNHTWEVIK